MIQQQKPDLDGREQKSLLQCKIPSIAFCLIMVVFMFSACNTDKSSNSATNSSAMPTPVATVTEQAQALSTADATEQAIVLFQGRPMQRGKTYPVKVYFSKLPESDNDFSAVFPVDRISPTTGVATFAMEQLIAGPTASERSAHYYSELNTIITGPSVCSADFTLALNKKGSTNEPGTATLKFCRMLSSPGIGADARIQSEVNATLKQFAAIKKVVILTKDGHCFGDESGRDMCLG